MAEKVDTKTESLPDLDDLLQCPVCYEIPSGQIFQCNEGHHVCGRCKMRLDMCPVCRALFFGTRNYAMEELIANVRKLRAFKLGGKITTGTDTIETNAEVKDAPADADSETTEEEENILDVTNPTVLRPPQACKGLFRCLCCKNGNGERLPAARLLNHLRYFHAPELIEGQTENGEYIQAWQFSTVPARIVTAVRISDMGIFFFIIEISNNSICAWLSMAASPWVAHEFSYTVTLSGNDREAIFSDCVWSVRSCEGSLRNRGHCLAVNGLDARALTAPGILGGKLSVRRTPPERLAQLPPPRAVLRVASRGPTEPRLEPFLQDLQNDVNRLSRAFANLGREADALVRSEAEMRARIEANSRNRITSAPDRPVPPLAAVTPRAAPPRPAPQLGTPPRPAPQLSAPPRLAPQLSASPRLVPQLIAAPRSAPPVPPPELAPGPERTLSRNARRRLRQRLRAAFNLSPVENLPQMQNGHVTHRVGLAIVQEPPVPPPPQPSSGPSNQNNNTRANKKRRRQRT